LTFFSLAGVVLALVDADVLPPPLSSLLPHAAIARTHAVMAAAQAARPENLLTVQLL
jgi:hypothetical protein